MPVTCTHLDEIREVDTGRDVCPECVAIGSRWVHLRQCLICGQTGCCSDSPNTHAFKHFQTVGHPVMRSLEDGEDWMWCFVDEETFRPASRGRYLLVDNFLEAGLYYAHQEVSERGSLPTAADAVVEDGFPLGQWMGYYRSRGRDALEPEQADALDALPGWTWDDPSET